MQTDNAHPIPSLILGAEMSARYDDPLDQDRADDLPIMITKRKLLRVALVAAETASRFTREQVDTDPMAWMLEPRRLFDGRAAIDGCLDRDKCLRAILIHGLSIGLDADPDEIDALAAVGDVEDDEHDDLDSASNEEVERGETARPRLWTSSLVGRCGTGTVQAFDAVVATDRYEAEARLRARHGADLVSDLDIVEGFDPTLPLIAALVSSKLIDILQQVAADSGSPLASGLSISVKQQFAS